MWELDCEEGWAPKNWCLWTVVLEKTLESPLDCREIQPIHSEGDQPWDFFGRNDAKGEGDDRGWDGWMASQARWTWVWVNSGSWWWTGRPGVLRFMGSQSRTRLSYWTELNWTELSVYLLGFPGGTSGKEPTCQYRRHKTLGFDPWVGKIPWRKARTPTLVFLPGESHRQKSLAAYSPQGPKESDMTEVTWHTCPCIC